MRFEPRQGKKGRDEAEKTQVEGSRRKEMARTSLRPSLSSQTKKERKRGRRKEKRRTGLIKKVPQLGG